MDNTALYITLWIASGAVIGGVVTPLLTAPRQFNDWLAMLAGTVAGAIGNLIALIPLWGLLWVRTEASTDTRPLWQRDATRVEDGTVVMDTGPSTAEMVGTLRANFWPQPRSEGHSHRMTYVGVAVALAVLTAIEVAVTFASGPIVTGILVTLSTIKVLLVMGFFMHLFYDSKWYTMLLLVVLPFSALILVVLALA